ncbi:MAG: sugar nucleotide-binding protein [Anaerolineae bacterium]|nr:sugar nucleotide-binding protein [Anaerolineae bacterium]
MANTCILILGGSGTLGRPLSVRAEAQGCDTVTTYLTNPDSIRAGLPVQLDLRDREALRKVVQTFAPEAIIHAAITERSGKGYDDAIRQSGEIVAQVAAKAHTRLIALSTDLVFAGTDTIYTEDSPTHPAQASERYGSAKIDYERVIQDIYPAALIVRTSLIYDFDPANPQVAWMQQAIERGDPVTLYTDQMRCPIWAVNLADALLELMETDASGLLHVVGPDLISRYDLGVALLDALGYLPDACVRPIPMPEGQARSLHLSVDRARTLLQTTRLLPVAEARAAWNNG